MTNGLEESRAKSKRHRDRNRFRDRDRNKRCEMRNSREGWRERERM